MIETTRRKMFSLLGMSPIAARAAVDNTIGQLAGLEATNGLGENAMWMSVGPPTESQIPYPTRIDRAATFMRLTGVPSVVEEQLREESRHVESLDPDLAAKRSWSMSVKIAEQRERNYRRRLSYMENQAKRQRSFSGLKNILGFDWPW